MNSTYLETELQYTPDRRRSIGDIFRILKYYIPTLTLAKLQEDLEQFKLECFICPDINKRVYSAKSVHDKYKGWQFPTNEFGMEIKSSFNPSESLDLINFIEIPEEFLK